MNLPSLDRVLIMLLYFALVGVDTRALFCVIVCIEHQVTYYGVKLLQLFNNIFVDCSRFYYL